MIHLLFFFSGASLASFLVVAAQRLPQGGSLVTPASHCDHCQVPLSWWHLWPVLSYLWLQGACAHCRQRFSPLSFVTELFLGSLFCIFYFFGVWHWHYLPQLLLLTGALMVSLTDWLYQVIEPLFFYPLFVLSLLSMFLPATALQFHFFESVLLFILLSSFNLGKERLGRGDIKLLSSWALCLGFLPTIEIIFSGSLLALLLGSFYFYRHGWQARLPFAPFLSLGLLIYSFKTFWL